MFTDTKVQNIFEHYEARAYEEKERMGKLGFSGRDQFLLPIGPEVGRFLHSLILAHQPKRILEIGTSYGYSTLFLADAARTVGGKLITLELVDYKQDYAKDKISEAGLESSVDFILGDAVDSINSDLGPFDFVLLDIWKELYVPCFEAVYPKLSKEAIIAADNMYFPQGSMEHTRLYRKVVNDKADLQTVLLSIGAGIELTHRWSEDSEKL